MWEINPPFTWNAVLSRSAIKHKLLSDRCLCVLLSVGCEVGVAVKADLWIHNLNDFLSLYSLLPALISSAESPGLSLHSRLAWPSPWVCCGGLDPPPAGASWSLWRKRSCRDTNVNSCPSRKGTINPRKSWKSTQEGRWVKHTPQSPLMVTHILQKSTSAPVLL